MQGKSIFRFFAQTLRFCTFPWEIDLLGAFPRENDRFSEIFRRFLNFAGGPGENQQNLRFCTHFRACARSHRYTTLRKIKDFAKKEFANANF